MRRILIGVVGSSPAVITETIWALAQRRPPWVPEEIRLFTTSHGREALVGRLFDDGLFAELCDRLGLPAGSIRFGPDQVHVFTDSDGAPLEDLRTPAQIAQSGDLLVQAVAELSADEDCEIHATIAGGRKTMSFYMGCVMTLFGRA